MSEQNIRDMARRGTPAVLTVAVDALRQAGDALLDQWRQFATPDAPKPNGEAVERMAKFLRMVSEELSRFTGKLVAELRALPEG